MSKPLTTIDEFTSCRRDSRGAPGSMHCCVLLSHLLQTPISPCSEMCRCHLCEHEGHLVEPCLLPAERTALASAPRLLILAPENQHILLLSEDRQGSAKRCRFLSRSCQQGRAVPVWPAALPLQSTASPALCQSPDLWCLLCPHSPSTKMPGTVNATTCTRFLVRILCI